MLFKILQKLLKQLFNLREKKNGEQRDENGDLVKPFLDHMEDLRWTLIKCGIVLIIFMTAAFVQRERLMRMLEYPVHVASGIVGENIRLRSDNIVDPFMIIMVDKDMWGCV